MRVAFATSSTLVGGQDDDREAAELTGAEFCVWNDPSVAWEHYDRVVIRSTWDYTSQLEAFLSWCRRVVPARLRNVPEIVEFSADKRYLQHLEVPTVPTVFVAAGDPLPTTAGQIVVKPNISAGARDAGRFASCDDADAIALINAIRSSGRVALVQPYLSSVDARGETTIIYIGGTRSHEVRKASILTSSPGAGQAREVIVTPTTATPEERDLAAEVHAEVEQRFTTPLYARIDLLDAGGQPVVSELELVEPHLFFAHAIGSAQRFTDAIALS
jgi:hypothetical protein